MKVKIKFVGTGSGKTSLSRYHSSILISSENYNLLIDAGDGISRALLTCNIDFNLIDGILFTHLHPDHFTGLPSLIVQMKMNNRIRPLDIFVHKNLKDFLEDYLLHSYQIPERMKFEIIYKAFNEDETIDISKNFLATTRKNSHLSKLENFTATYPQLHFPCLSLQFEVSGKKIIYTSDIENDSDLFLFEKEYSNIFITEPSHLNLNVLFSSLEKIQTEKIYLTHIGDEVLIRLNEKLATLPDGIRSKTEIAEDCISFDI